MAAVLERRMSINKNIFGDVVEASDEDIARDLQRLEIQGLTGTHTVPSSMQSSEVDQPLRLRGMQSAQVDQPLRLRGREYTVTSQEGLAELVAEVQLGMSARAQGIQGSEDGCSSQDPTSLSQPPNQTPACDSERGISEVNEPMPIRGVAEVGTLDLKEEQLQVCPHALST